MINCVSSKCNLNFDIRFNGSREIRQALTGQTDSGISRANNMSSEDADKVKESVKDYYGKRLKTSDDLQTNACKFEERTIHPAVKDALKLIHEEVSSK